MKHSVQEKVLGGTAIFRKMRRKEVSRKKKVTANIQTNKLAKEENLAGSILEWLMEGDRKC